MSRHRNIRSMNYTDEYDGYDDVYGHSMEDDYCISPSDAAQFLYDREGSRSQQKISAFLTPDEDIAEEDETVEKTVDEFDQARLESCIEQIKTVLEVNIPKSELVNVIIKNNFNVEASINQILTKNNEVEKTERKINKENSPSHTSLSSLASSHLGPEKKLSIPKIFSPNTEVKFSSLSDLTKNHLKNNMVNKNSIFGNKINIENKNILGINKSLSKISIKDNQNIESTNTENDWCIDLSQALKVSSTSTSKTRLSESTENFTPQFVSYEKSTNVTHKNIYNCTFDIKNEMMGKNPLRCRPSSFGKIVRKVFIYRRPFIDVTKSYYNIKKFNFETQSPDDLVLKHLRRK